jgi:ABC-type thiamine transport system ATPase subunit
MAQELLQCQEVEAYSIIPVLPSRVPRGGKRRIARTLHQEQGMTVIMVTHDHYIAGHAERVLELRDGKLQC